MLTHGRKCMKKTKRRYDRDFKISVIAELEAGKPLAQVARKITRELMRLSQQVLSIYADKEPDIY
jgi:transposase-like protein